jgi:hypothetical protein
MDRTNLISMSNYTLSEVIRFLETIRIAFATLNYYVGARPRFVQSGRFTLSLWGMNEDFVPNLILDRGCRLLLILFSVRRSLFAVSVATLSACASFSLLASSIDQSWGTWALGSFPPLARAGVLGCLP